MALLTDSVTTVVEDDDDERAVARSAVGVGVLGALYAAYGVLVNPLRPRVTAPLGYYAWIDQSFYLRTAHVLAGGHLPTKPDDYMYGLGYPLLGAIASKLGFPTDPFAPVNVVLFGVLCACTFVLAVRVWSTAFGRRSLVPGFVTVALLAFATPMFQLVITPWNSTLVTTLMAVVLVIITSPGAITWPRAAAIGLLIGWVLATRYGDAAFVTLPVAGALVARVPRERLRVVAGGGIALAAVVAFVAYTQHHAFGDALTTPYHFHRRLGPGLGNDQSLSNYRLRWVPRHFLTTVITGPKHDGIVGGEPMLRQFPALLLVPFGVVRVARRSGRARLLWIGVVVAATLSSIFYLSFIAGGGDDLKYWNLRYWAIWYPLAACFAVVGGRLAYEAVERWRIRGTAA